MRIRHALSRLSALTLVGLLGVALLGRGALADGLVRDGMGAISMGRGGTNLGFYDNAAIISDNAAGMVNVAGNGLFDANADTLITDLHYSNPLNSDVAAHTRPFVAPTLGYIRKSDDGDWAYGIGAFVPAGFGAHRLGPFHQKWGYRARAPRWVRRGVIPGFCRKRTHGSQSTQLIFDTVSV